MDYHSYSIKAVVNSINNSNSGWFLPAIQRPYVWGSRYEQEKYICKLFDSILKGYPIGSIILWRPDKQVAFREFLGDYKDGTTFAPKDETNFSLGCALVYDGQQRLQTIYSCLKYSILDRFLVFDLSYDKTKDLDQDTGFRFVDNDAQMKQFEIRMSRVFTLTYDLKLEARKEFKDKTTEESMQRLIELNLDTIYDIFANQKLDTKSISTFEIQGATDDEVNEIFQRLNMGGVQLSNADLLYSRIKEIEPNFESEIIEFTQDLSRKYATIDSYDVLQIIHIIIKGKTKIDPKFKKSPAGTVEKQLFVKCWEDLKVPLEDTMIRYLNGHFCINNMRIIPRKMPLLAVIVYMYYLYKDKGNYVSQEKDKVWLQQLDKFFITAELNDWAMQSYIDAFAEIFKNNPNKKVFPFNQLFAWVKNKNNRFVDVSEKTFCDNRWFSLKVVLPNDVYTFQDNMTKRFNPELDHIFPVKLAGQSDAYKKEVDVIWNLQPVVGDINIDKSNYHPLDYFTDKIAGHPGSQYFGKYKEVPNTLDPIWNDYKAFINNRRTRFIQLMKNNYDIDIV